jgi:hypothetical protein
MEPFLRLLNVQTSGRGEGWVGEEVVGRERSIGDTLPCQRGSVIIKAVGVSTRKIFSITLVIPP